jgi:hypothetical protein
MTQRAKPRIREVADLALLFPRAVPLDLGTFRAMVPVLDFRRIAQIMVIAEPILAEAPGRPLPEVLAEHTGAIVEILAIAMAWPIDRVEALPPHATAQLFATLVDANQGFFRDPDAPPGVTVRKGREESTWVDVAALLTARGHTDLGAMTPAQAVAFAKAHIRADNRGRRARVVDVRNAMHAKDEDLRRYLKALGD